MKFLLRKSEMSAMSIIMDENNNAVGTLVNSNEEWLVTFHKHKFLICPHTQGDDFGMTGTHSMGFKTKEKAKKWLEDYNNCQRFGLMLEFAPDGKIIEFSWENS
jgi:hypothetical protein